MNQPHDRETVVELVVKSVMAFINEAKLKHVFGCVYAHTCTPPTFAVLNLKAKHTVQIGMHTFAVWM